MREPLTKADLDVAINQLEGYIDERLTLASNRLTQYIDERTHDAETRLLRGFADYNVSAGVRFRKLEADYSNVETSTTLRLGELERRLTDVDIRTIRLEGGK